MTIIPVGLASAYYPSFKKTCCLSHLGIPIQKDFGFAVVSATRVMVMDVAAIAVAITAVIVIVHVAEVEIHIRVCLPYLSDL